MNTQHLHNTNIPAMMLIDLTGIKSWQMYWYNSKIEVGRNLVMLFIPVPQKPEE